MFQLCKFIVIIVPLLYTTLYTIQKCSCNSESHRMPPNTSIYLVRETYLLPKAHELHLYLTINHAKAVIIIAKNIIILFNKRKVKE